MACELAGNWTPPGGIRQGARPVPALRELVLWSKTPLRHAAEKVCSGPLNNSTCRFVASPLALTVESSAHWVPVLRAKKETQAEMRPIENAVADSRLKSGQGAKDLNSRKYRVWVLLSLMVVASFAVILAALAYWQTGTIESEGAEYAKIAENLRNGVGFVGLVSSGPQVNFPPLFPLLIAGASFVTHDYESAGRLVALVMGALLPLD